MLVSLIFLATNVGAPNLETAAADFLAAYARGDESKVLSVVVSSVHIYGSDASEAIVGRDAFKALWVDDLKLWGSDASFGKLRNVSSERDGSLATLFFDADFIVHGRSIPVRFATVWRLEGNAWKLAQESNVVPTVGQSAAEILRGSRAPRQNQH